MVVLQPPKPPGPDWQKRCLEMSQLLGIAINAFNEYAQAVAIPGIPHPPELQKLGETMLAVGVEHVQRMRSYAVEEEQAGR